MRGELLCAVSHLGTVTIQKISLEKETLLFFNETNSNSLTIIEASHY